MRQGQVRSSSGVSGMQLKTLVADAVNGGNVLLGYGEAK